MDKLPLIVTELLETLKIHLQLWLKIMLILTLPCSKTLWAKFKTKLLCNRRSNSFYKTNSRYRLRWRQRRL